MGQDQLLILGQRKSGYKLKVYSYQNKDYKGIEVKIIMSENDPSYLRLYEAFYIRKCSASLHSIPGRKVVNSQTFYFSILQTILKHF